MENTMHVRTIRLAAVLGLAMVGAAACASDPASTEPGAVLLTVSPAGGATGMEPAGPVVVTFGHPIHPHMVTYVALHEGDVRGPVVDGTWRLEAEGTWLVFTPTQPLQPVTAYTIHLGGGMTDTHGRHVDLETHGAHMGGHWASGSMMTGGMMGGGHDHMNDGWNHSGNGSYGMVFTFTTGG
jgi:hypothetical protein